MWNVNKISRTGKFTTYLQLKLGNSQPKPPKRYQEKTEESLPETRVTTEIEGWSETDQIVQDDLAVIETRLADCLENSGLTKLADNSDIMAQISTSTRAYFFLTKLQEESTSNHEIRIMLQLLELKSILVKPVLRFLKWDAKKLTYKTLEASIRQNRELLEAICYYEQLACERLILGFVQRMINRNKKSLLSYTANIIYLLYTEDILSEEVILEWETTPSKFVKTEADQKMKLKCQQIFDWLKTADDNSSEDDSSVSYSDVKNYVRQYYNYESEQESDAESEIDIDKI